MRAMKCVAVGIAVAFVLVAGTAQAEQEELDGSHEQAVKQATELRVQATALAKAGDFITADEKFTQSLDIARSVGDRRSRDWTLLFIATAQARAGSVYAGIETANSIETEAYQMWALEDIAPIQAASGDLAGAFETAQAIPEGEVRANAYGEIAIQQARLGDIMQAGLTADKITVPETKFRAYVAITNAMAKNRP